MGCASSAETHPPPEVSERARSPSAPSATRESSDLPPILFIRLHQLLDLAEVPRLGISPSQRKSLGYAEKQHITDVKVKETLVQDWRNLYICVGDNHFPATDVLVELEDINMEKSVVGFVSHCWLRGWSGAPGYQDRPHPDDAHHNKHKLTKEALKQLHLSQFNGCADCYVWIDYCCINQDGNPAAELKQLDLIIKSCDFLLTPVHEDKDGSWDLPPSFYSYFVAYKAEAWQQYLTRGWCLVEMMYAANVPLKDNAASESKLEMINGPALKNGLNRGHRAHFLYGTRESRFKGAPIGLPPLQNSFFAEYNPITHGEVSSPADKAKIVELVSELQPYIDAHTVKVGYVGDLDSNGVYNGRGTYVYASGSVYEGEWKDGHKSGFGKCVYASGAIYEGEWKDDLMSGSGKYVSADGRVYDGEWENDVMHGHGRLVYADGSVYEGQYKDNARNGYGRYVFASGRVQEGDFREGQFVG